MPPLAGASLRNEIKCLLLWTSLSTLGPVSLETEDMPAQVAWLTRGSGHQDRQPQ